MQLAFLCSDMEGGSYADGLWHRLEFKASLNRIIMVIDNKSFITSRQLTFTAGSTFYIGGMSVRLSVYPISIYYQ